jgi:hypothetical protein
VGSDEQKYTLHMDMLRQAKFFATFSESSFRDRKDTEILLPEEEPEVFEKILEYLYHDKIEAEVFDLREDGDAAYTSRETQTILLMAKVWVAANKYCMEACQNHIMDYFVAHCVNRVPPMLIVSEISKQGLRHCLLKKLVMREVAAWLLTPGHDWEEQLKEGSNNNVMEVMDSGGNDAKDFFKACVQWVVTQRDEKEVEEPCRWHVHKITKKCPLP